MSKGIQLEIAHHPQMVLDAMDGLKEQVVRSDRRSKIVGRLSCMMIIVGILLFVGFIFLVGEVNGALNKALIITAGILGFIMIPVGAGLASRRRPSHSSPTDQFDFAYQILHTLRDDTGAKGRVTGFVDLTGPKQKEKLARSARSGGGKTKEYYQDPWLQLKFKLADGNVLRLTLADKLKFKAGSLVNYRTQAKTKLVINPQVYSTDKLPAPALQNSLTSNVVNLSAEIPRGKVSDWSLNQVRDPKLRSILTMPDEERIGETSNYVLGVLRGVYANLEPIEGVNSISTAI